MSDTDEGTDEGLTLYGNLYPRLQSPALERSAEKRKSADAEAIHSMHNKALQQFTAMSRSGLVRKFLAELQMDTLPAIMAISLPFIRSAGKGGFLPRDGTLHIHFCRLQAAAIQQLNFRCQALSCRLPRNTSPVQVCTYDIKMR